MFHDPRPKGIRVGPADLPTPSSAERRKLLRDALRLTLWRATGSTGAWPGLSVISRMLLIVCMYCPGFRVWAGYGGFGI